MIRTVEPDDIAIFYDQQDDPVASEMAAFPVRDRSAHEAHWAKILANDAVTYRARSASSFKLFAAAARPSSPRPAGRSGKTS